MSGSASSPAAPSAGDVDPAGGAQTFTSPPSADKNANGASDITEVAKSVIRSEIGVFTTTGDAGGSTEFDPAITIANDAFVGQPAGEANVVFFLTDGVGSLSTGAGSPLAAADGAGTVINTFSVGGSASGCGTGTELRTMADTTGGTCREVADPSQLSATLGGVTPAGISSVEVSVNGGTPVVATLDALGNYTATVPGVTSAASTIVATVIANDGTRVSADIVVNGTTPGTPPPPDHRRERPGPAGPPGPPGPRGPPVRRGPPVTRGRPARSVGRRS